MYFSYKGLICPEKHDIIWFHQIDMWNTWWCCHKDNLYFYKSIFKAIQSFINSLKMLGLYLYTFIIGHKYCNMLSILNKWTLHKELHIFLLIMCFWTRSKNTTTTKEKKSNIKTLDGPGNWTRDLLQPKRMLYHCTTESTESLYCSQAI